MPQLQAAVIIATNKEEKKVNYESIIYQKSEGIASITLNRPEVLNALNSQLLEELVSALEDARDDEATKVVVITGAGRGFCSGAELKALLSGDKSLSTKGLTPIQTSNQGRLGVQRLPRLVESIEKPIIASINGVANGFGFDLASMCDIRIASSKAAFSINHLRVGALSLDGGYYYLVRILGIPKTLELVWTWEVFDAAKALELGYVSRVVPEEDLAKATLELTRMLAQGPSVQMQIAKRLICRAWASSLDESLEDVEMAWALTRLTEDAEEGVKAIMERRKPNFKGK